MYKIQKESWGFKLTFDGFIPEQEMKKWYEESLKHLSTVAGGFGVFVDMRTMKVLPKESQAVLQEGQKHYKEKGMQRSVVILNDALATMQLKRIAKETGIYEWERYIDASADPNWEATALAWVKDGKDPDK